MICENKKLQSLAIKRKMEPCCVRQPCIVHSITLSKSKLAHKIPSALTRNSIPCTAIRQLPDTTGIFLSNLLGCLKLYQAAECITGKLTDKTAFAPVSFCLPSITFILYSAASMTIYCAFSAGYRDNVDLCADTFFKCRYVGDDSNQFAVLLEPG